jgi:AcrR family transcriptional regulator
MSSSDDHRPPRRRLPAGARHQQVLQAAVAAFAGGGYAGTTTDQVARLAGVSQPYVVRMFGGKQALFLAAHHHVVERIEAAFRAAAAGRDPGVEPLEALGRAYLELTSDRNLLKVLQHGLVAGADPALGPAARTCLTRIYRLVRELTGATPEQARDFVANGLLINTLVCADLPEHAADDPAAAQLVQATLGITTPAPEPTASSPMRTQ